jgi:transposase
MHIVNNKSTSKTGKKIYQSTLLRESYRENGKVKKRTIANLTGCTPQEIYAIKLALKHKDDLSSLGSLKESVEIQEGLSVGAVWTLYQCAKELGIVRALGNGFMGKLALWQVIARIIDQGSRLSSVRLAQTHAAGDVLDLRRGFDENDLYQNLEWLADNQLEIENKMFQFGRSQSKPQLFLYDVTSSYLEGDKNYFAAYGYNRDRKKGKKQIVIGLLCDDSGEPISVEVFNGNTQDQKTFAAQVAKTAQRFDCKGITFVGDRGMIKSAQIKELPEGFHYITAITKPQIDSLLKQKVVQLGLFDKDVCEVENNGIRYILRKNPIRAKEIAQKRLSKHQYINEFLEKKNLYLREHPRAKVEVAMRDARNRIECLKLDKWLQVKTSNRALSLQQDDAALKEASLLDGCYVIKTDLSRSNADKQIIHDRYKDLAKVEKAFRYCKTGLLEVRPIFVRTKKNTRGHVLVVMLAYMIIRKLAQAWKKFNLEVEEGIDQLSTLCSMEVIIKGQGSCLKIPRPREKSRQLLKALNIRMPVVLPHRDLPVVTRTKLQNQRIYP